MNKEPITLNGLNKLKEELVFLKEKKRPEIVAAIAEARSHGDLKENAEYHAAREEQGLNEARIRELEDVLGTSQVVEYKQMGVEDRVIFGSTVTIKDIENDEIKKYQIVGDAEADIENNTISFTTPMARALLKKELGEFIEVHTPGGDKEFEIINIELN